MCVLRFALRLVLVPVLVSLRSRWSRKDILFLRRLIILLILVVLVIAIAIVLLVVIILSKILLGSFETGGGHELFVLCFRCFTHISVTCLEKE